ALVIFHSVDQVFDDLQSKAMDRRMTLVNVVDKHLECWADDDRLQQVLFNLVDNAIKYGRPEGKVTVSAQIIEEKFLDVSVADDGPGIPAEAKERVFERFYRVDKARSRDQGGTGLGLSIVKHIVLSHGGEVWVDSQVGQGSAFHFTLPLAKGAKPLVSLDRVRREPALDVGLS
ncbi:MAG: cell wall metabolism sensor histidine kinase WalK, partial [Verrucomicrobia bacterium]